MRRNKMMRAACLLMVLTMITTCSFSGALAKYVVSDYTTDTARVAKFGVVVTAAGNLFGQRYYGNDAVKTNNAGNKITAWTAQSNDYVASAGADFASTDKLVAPGAKNDEGMTFTVTGTPEVATKITVGVPEGETTGTGGNNDKDYTNTDIFLKQNAYSIMVQVAKTSITLTDNNCGDYYKFTAGTGTGSGTFTKLATAAAADGETYVYKRVQMTGGTNATMAANYYPIDWWLTENGTPRTAPINGAAAMQSGDGSVTQAVATALANGAATHTPSQAWNSSVKVAWKWNFTNNYDDTTSLGGAFTDADGVADFTLPNYENTTLRDLEDTILGEMIAQAKDNLTTYYIAVGETDATTVTEVKYVEVDAATNSANKVILAYADTAAANTPTDTTGWQATSNIACLTVTFGARVTVEQIDYIAPVTP